MPQAIQKRAFDVVVSAVGLTLSGWLILLAWVAASLDTRSNGFFTQRRVGKDGRLFTVVKIKTMRPSRELTTTVTRSGDPRITPLGRFFRRTKIDELPQLWNVLVGDMSFVGPRPDVPGFADTLEGEERLLLTIRPGITGPATLKYRDEEAMLAAADDPEAYNREVIWPDKVRLNLDYIRDWRLTDDLRYIWRTVVG
ncbi:Sugar transferase involved in LPS biosynthesis (colanic, teichoic acid) [Halomonas shengliensis]|uniref:Sugar transferase involved in LPS biosynthesis (Colanic, teichoic acid) n=1 Tax=Halomonas shengliensis TaxID=419597 RepID=A0A1H0L3V9_9GAMM|nr:sugar transferase [Halomonas shengliensis]SDO62964.1 Sugar transferase involved in LPS biosynthesis (colanic, teichoic acid) [Halomonas shengliensis]